jgi:hypothetical protein
LIKEGGKDSRRSFMNSVPKYGRRRLYYNGWKYGIMCPNQKKGDVAVSNNYRAVTLQHITYKFLVNILYVKLVPYAEEKIGEYSGGFQRQRSPAAQIFTMTIILEKC